MYIEDKWNNSGDGERYAVYKTIEDNFLDTFVKVKALRAERDSTNARSEHFAHCTTVPDNINDTPGFLPGYQAGERKAFVNMERRGNG